MTGVSGAGQQAYFETMKIDAQAQAAKAKEANAAQIASKATLKEEEAEVTIAGLLKKTERVKKTLSARKVNKSVKPGDKGESIKGVGEITDREAREFADDNSEFQGKKSELLAKLRKEINTNLTKDQILDKTLTFFGEFDAHTIDEALRFLEIVFKDEPGVKEKVIALRQDLVDGDKGQPKEITLENGTHVTINPRDIAAGRKIGVISREYVAEGFEKVDVSPTDLRKMYHQITHQDQLDARAQYEMLSKQYPSFKDLKKVIKFMLHTLGKESKDEGVLVEKGKLNAILVEVRVMQAIYATYNFFRIRQRLVVKQFDSTHSPLPPLVTFENMARQFMKFISDRFPSADKAKHLGDPMGIAQDHPNEIIIILSQFRDAIREVSPRNFQGEDHKLSCLVALVEALEDVEDELEELESQDQPDEQQGAQPSLIETISRQQQTRVEPTTNVSPEQQGDMEVNK